MPDIRFTSPASAEHAVMVWCGPGFGHARVFDDNGKPTTERVFVHHAGRATGATLGDEIMLAHINPRSSAIPRRGQKLYFWRRPPLSSRDRFDLAGFWMFAEQYEELLYQLTASRYRIVDGTGTIIWEGDWSSHFPRRRPRTHAGRLPRTHTGFDLQLQVEVPEDCVDRPLDEPSVQIPAYWQRQEEWPKQLTRNN